MYRDRDEEELYLILMRVFLWDDSLSLALVRYGRGGAGTLSITLLLRNFPHYVLNGNVFGQTISF